MMPTTPPLLKHATVAPGVGAQFRTPAPSTREIVCENIRLACVYRGITRHQLASLLGLPYNAIHKIWHHTRKVTADELWVVAKIVRIPVERFYDLHGWGDFDWINPKGNRDG